MRRLLSALMAIILLFAVSSSCFAEEKEEPIHNYILIIDNSLSTTGSHSLGGATDPKGMRFDAARLVYENVLSSAKVGNRGKICVIVFCGPEHCVPYGPMDIGEDAETLRQAVGKYLNESFPHERDGYTDIRTAVETARDILAGFQGDSSVILLTDGINALVNSSDPFNEQVNIEANDQTVKTVEQIRKLGADFYIVALTAKDSVSNKDAFMEFINRMALAGGGEAKADGSCDNVLMATQADLNSKLLQILIKSENTGDTALQTSSLEEGGDWSFQVPYEGISNETVNLTFMPEELEKIKDITLEAPDGTSYTIYENGVLQSPEGIEVTADRSYIIVDIPSPQSGEWKLSVDSDEQAEVNSVVRLNQNLRVCTDMPESAVAGESVPVQVWVQQFDGEQYVDLNDPDFYAQSIATMTMKSPGINGRTESLTMEQYGDRFVTEIAQEKLGEWTMDFQVSNDFWSDNLGSTAFDVISSVTEGLKEIESAVVTTGSEGEEFTWQLETDPNTGMMTVSWDEDIPGEFTAELRDADSGMTVIPDIHSGDTIDLEALGLEREYALIATAYSSSDGEADFVPTMQKLDIQIIPDLDQLGGAMMAVMDSVVTLAPGSLFLPSAKSTAEPASPEGSQDSASADADAESGGEKGLMGKLADNWVILAAAAVVIIIVLALIFGGRRNSGERVTGRLKLVCEPIQLDMLLLFDGRGSIKVDSPLTKHPDVAKLKSGKIYNVLSQIQVSMSKADTLGRVEGSDEPHTPGESLITLSCSDPRTGEWQIVHIGRLDYANVVLHVYDAGRVFDVSCSNGMSF